VQLNNKLRINLNIENSQDIENEAKKTY